MSNEKDLIPTTDGAENATDGANEAGGANVPEEKKTAATSASTMYNHKFKTPFEYEGKKYSTLNFDFERLTGRDMIAIESEMQANNEYALDPLLSKSFQCKMAARACGIGGDALEAMPIREFNRITNAARNFLIDSGY